MPSLHAPLLSALLLLLSPSSTSPCSNFQMQNEYQISVRTMDLGLPFAAFGIRTVARGAALAAPAHAVARLGFVSFVPEKLGVVMGDMVAGGMNEAGLSCDLQTLLGTVYPAKTGNASTDLPVNNLCEWLLGHCASVDEARAALANRTVTPHGPCLAGGSHWVLRDAAGRSLVIEFGAEAAGTGAGTTAAEGAAAGTARTAGGVVVGAEGSVAAVGVAHLYLDLNDEGATGFGIMTNEPVRLVVRSVVRAWRQRDARSSTHMGERARHNAHVAC